MSELAGIYHSATGNGTKMARHLPAAIEGAVAKMRLRRITELATWKRRQPEAKLRVASTIKGTDTMPEGRALTTDLTTTVTTVAHPTTRATLHSAR